MLSRFSAWLDNRTGYKKFVSTMLLEHVPGGARWRYIWGSMLAFVFSIQLLTGVLLMTSYSPGDSTAWGSVYFIQYEMEFGWLIRGLHHFGSQTMVVLLACHMLQVVIAGAHLAPREVNWWLGLGLMGAILALSLTGYLLPWDQKGFWATQVATNIAGSLPGPGAFIKRVVVGGAEYGNHTLTRFYALHVGILPLTVIVLLVLHIVAFRRHGVTAPKLHGEGEGVGKNVVVGAGLSALFAALVALLIWGGLDVKLEIALPPLVILGLAILFIFMDVAFFRRHPSADLHEEHGKAMFWPDQAFKDLVGCMVTFSLLLVLVMWGAHGNEVHMDGAESGEKSAYETLALGGRDGRGANLDAPADPGQAYPARPEWYFLFLFQLLKYFEGDLNIVGTVVIPNGVAVLLFLLPLFGYGRMRPLGHLLGIVVVVGILGGVSTLTCLAFADDMDEAVNRQFMTQVGLVGVPALAGVLLLFLGILALLPRSGFRSVVFGAGVVVLAVLAGGIGSGVYGALSDTLPQQVRDKMNEQVVVDEALTKKLENSHTFRQQLKKAEANAQRAVQLAHKGIPSAGAIQLLQRDPMTRGKELFKVNCNACHRYGSDFPASGKVKGGGKKDADGKEVVQREGSDLAGFGSPDPVKRQEWIRGLLEHPDDDKYFGSTRLTGMIKWSTKMHANRDKMKPDKKAEYNQWLDDVAAWLATQPTKGAPLDDKDVSAHAKGYRAFFDEEKKSNCSSCHSYKKEGGRDAPDLTGYGSADWTRLMIMSPGHALRHGKNNEMPAFRNDQGPGAEVQLLEFRKEFPDLPMVPLSDVDRELIIRYLLQDDRLVFFGRPVSGPPEPKKKS